MRIRQTILRHIPEAHIREYKRCEIDSCGARKT